jgi:hypothetical protein
MQETANTTYKSSYARYRILNKAVAVAAAIKQRQITWGAQIRVLMDAATPFLKCSINQLTPVMA